MIKGIIILGILLLLFGWWGIPVFIAICVISERITTHIVCKHMDVATEMMAKEIIKSYNEGQ